MEEGKRIADRYVLARRLGRGGMGEVWLAHDEKLRREVAIKLMHQGGSTERLIREARSLAGVSHPGIVQVHDVGVHEGMPYLVMERVEGSPLRARVGSMMPDEVVRAVREIAEALEVAHRAGVVHRDIKPDNVMTRGDGRLVLLDFGLATESGRATQEESDDVTVERLTESGAILGTPAYLSPEQARGRDVGPAADQFALCVMAAELVRGRLPWDATSAPALLAAILTEEPDLDGVPEPLRTTLSRGLRKSPSDRFESMAALAASLDAGALGPQRPRASRRALGSVGLALALLGGLAGWAAFGAGRTHVEDTIEPAALRWGESTVACPQLEVRGEEAGGWLGAAVASDICSFLWIALGVPPSQVRPPASLLGLPAEPSDDAPLDPFSADDARARQLEAARAVDAWIDGSVELADGELRVRAMLRDRHDRVLGEVDVRSAPGAQGIDVVRALRAAGTLPARDELDPDAMAVVGARRVDSALAVSALLRQRAQFLTAADPPCVEVRRLRDVDRRVARELPDGCRPSHLRDPVEPPREGRFAAVVEARSAYVESRAQIDAGDPSLGLATAMRSVRAWPSGPGWIALTFASRHTELAAPVARCLTYWHPESGGAWTQLGSELEPGSDAQLEHTRRGYLLEPQPATSLDLAALLQQRGRRSDVRAIAARLLDADRRSVIAQILIAAADAGDGKLRSARARIRRVLERDDWQFGAWVNQDMILVDVVGQMRAITGSTELVDEFVRRFVLAEPSRFEPDGATWQLRGATVMCALASETLAAACVDRVSALAQARFFVRATPGSDDLLAAVAAWLRGDARAAAPHVRRFATVESAWDVHTLGLVVSPILDEAGEHDLAERLDRTAIRVGDRHFNGAAAVTVRAAFRAAARREETRAADLARRAVESFEIADVEVARLDDLRSLAGSGAPRSGAATSR